MFISLIKGYKYLISPIIPPCCRFYPSCSRYTAEAIKQHGVWRGMFFGLKRILRCHPWGGSGYDPVPTKRVSHDGF